MLQLPIHQEPCLRVDSAGIVDAIHEFHKVGDLYWIIFPINQISICKLPDPIVDVHSHSISTVLFDFDS